VNTRELGALGERIAACFLMMKGYSILTTGYRFRGKEIDVVAERGTRIVFVEVKLRRSGRSGAPREAVDSRKMRHVLFAARGFLAQAGLEDRPCRFDVVELSLARGGLTLVVEHIVAAFGEER
jgi:putative endonuclease